MESIVKNQFQDPVCLVDSQPIQDESHNVSKSHQIILQCKDRLPLSVIATDPFLSCCIYSPILYEIEQKDPSARLIIYHYHTGSVTFYFTNDATEQDQFLLDLHTLSNVVCFSTEPDASNLTEDKPLLWCMFEYSIDKKYCIVNGYIASRSQITQGISEYEKQHDKFCFIDIDRTIGITFDDCPEHEKNYFRTDIMIEGFMYVGTDYFRHGFMMRDGLYDCIRFLQEHGITIYFITWGDLSYGREIIKKLNDINWKNTIEQREEREETDNQLFIPLAHVFSRRNTLKKALPKHFRNSVPFYKNETKRKCMGIDDDPMAWYADVRDRIYQISRFSPLHNYRSDLLTAVYQIVTYAYL